MTTGQQPASLRGHTSRYYLAQTGEGDDVSGKQGVSLVVIVLAVLISAGSTAEAPAAAEQLSDPVTTAPEIRKQVVGPEQLPDLVIDYDRRPRDGLFSSNSIMKRGRGPYVVDGWERRMFHPDFTYGVDVSLVETRSSKIASEFARTIPDGGQELVLGIELPSSLDAVWFDATLPYAVVSGTLGRSMLSMEIFSPVDEDSGERTLDTEFVTHVVGEQLALVTPGDDEPYSESMSWRGLQARGAIEAAFRIVWILLLIGIYQFIRDPASRDRIRARFASAAPDLPHHTNVDAEARAQLWAMRRSSRRRGIGVLMLVFVIGMLPIGLTAIVWLTVGGVILLGLGESAVGALLGRPRIYTGWTFVAGGLLGIVAAVMVGLALSLFFVAAAPVGEIIEGDTFVGNVQRVSVLAALIVLVLAAVPVWIARMIGMGRLAKHSDSLEGDTVLLLRSFVDDNVKLRTRSDSGRSLLDRMSLRRWNRFEELIGRTLGSRNRVIALSEPGTHLRPIGAVRRSLSNVDWQYELPAMMDSALAIVVILGRTESLGWEIMQLRARGLLDHTVFVLPPVAALERRRRIRALSEWLGTDPQYLDHDVPGRRVLAIRFDAELNPALYTSGACDDVSYRIVLRRALEDFATQRVPKPTPWDNTAAVGAAPFMLAQGTARKQKPWWRSSPSVIGLLTVAIIYMAVSILLDLAGVGDMVEYTMVAEGSYNVVTTTDDGEVFAAGSGGELVQIRGDGNTRSIASVDGLVTRLAIIDRTAVAFTSEDYRIVAIDVDSGETLWSRTTPHRVSGLVVNNDSLVLVVSASRTLMALNIATGETLAEEVTSDIPWSVARDGDRLLVTLANVGQIAVVDPATVETIGTVDVPVPVRDVVASDAGLVGISSIGERLVDIDDGTALVGGLTRTEGILMSQGRWLVVHERLPSQMRSSSLAALTIIDTLNLSQHLAITPFDVRSIAPRGDNLIVASPSGLFEIHAN